MVLYAIAVLTVWLVSVSAAQTISDPHAYDFDYRHRTISAGQVYSQQVYYFNQGSVFYSIEDHRQGQLYEIKVCYPSDKPTIVDMALLFSNMRGRGRRLLNTEILRQQDLNEDIGVPVIEVLAKPEGVIRTDTEPPLFFTFTILVDPLLFNILPQSIIHVIAVGLIGITLIHLLVARSICNFLNNETIRFVKSPKVPSG
eukprot:Clim_evm29s157 gene=Clim_evmTU29s157